MKQTTLTFKGWPILIITLLVAIFQLIGPSQVWTITFISFSAVQLIALIWARALRNDIYLLRERRYTWAQVGDRLEERFTLTNNSLFPALWVEIKDHATMPNYSGSQVTGLGSKATNRWNSNGICTQRGIFQLGPTDLKMGDPFGLFQVQHHYPSKVDFMIVPPILPLPTLEIATQGQLGEGNPRRYNLLRSQTASDVRPYHPGDSLNRVHWPTTARRNSLYIHNLEETAASDWWLVLDLDANAHHTQNNNQSNTHSETTLEKTILMAASLTNKGLSENHAVGLLAQGQTSVCLPPQASALQQWQILKALAQVKAGNLTLEQLLTRSRQLFTRKSSLVIITASITLNWLEPLLLLQRQRITPTIIFIYNDTTAITLQASYQVLVSKSITTHLIDQASLKPSQDEAAAGKWEWYITATGKAIATHKPKGTWKPI